MTMVGTRHQISYLYTNPLLGQGSPILIMRVTFAMMKRVLAVICMTPCSIELFLDEAPFNFNPFKLTKLSNFDDIVLNEELMHIMANPNFQQVAQVSPQSFSLTYITRGCETKICHDQETLYNQSTTRLSHF
ncbi:hypothetical protein GLYMA_12G161850v4 [Glycine max]|nr:hypothetical protein GLYMA_12G161850v4 [Glycine max]KAH1143441.1 hypothetical protein GYH30_033932 [Glycine max]